MVAPKKIFKKLEGGGRGMLSTGGASRKAVVKVKPKPDTKAEPKSNVTKRRSVRPEEERKYNNDYTTRRKVERKSGKAAKDAAESVRNFNKSYPSLKQPTKKIK